MTSATAHSIAGKLLQKPLAIRKQRFRRMRSYVKLRLIRRTCARQEELQSFVDAFLTAITYIIFHMESRHDIEADIISYEQDTESDPTDVSLEYQQCQMECNHDSCNGSDDFQDAVPIAEPRLSSSRYGVRGSIATSSLLPSDAEQMLRVCLSMPEPIDITHTESFCLSSLREEATFMPSCVFDELCMQYTDLMQLHRMLSQDWLQSWTRWLQIQVMITLYDHNQDMKKQLCKDVIC